MSSSTLDGGTFVEEGIEISEAFQLPTPETPERKIVKILAQIGENLDQLEKLAKTTDAESTEQAVRTYRSQLIELSRKAGQNEKEDKLVAKGVELLIQIKAELSVPAREGNVVKAIGEFKKHAGPPGKPKAAEFELEKSRIDGLANPIVRCSDYWELEREVTKADLYFQEQANPGSTWQTRMDFAVEDAMPHNLPKEGAQEGAKIGAKEGFFSVVPLGTLIGAGLGAAIGAVAGKIKESREKPPLDAGEWQQMGKSFAASMDKKIADMTFSVPQEAVTEFTGEARQAIQEIREEHFAADRLPDTRQKMGKALMVANTAALSQLSTLKRDYPADATPQVFVTGGKMTVAKQAPKLESLVLQGGGGKGVGFPAMLEEMNKSGMLENVDLLVGTSIGALNAACLACGGLSDEREILNLEIMKQAFDSKNSKKKYPGVTFGKDAWPSCAGQMAKMDELTSKSVTEKLKSRTEEQLEGDLAARLRDLDDDALERMGLKGADDAAIQKQVQALAKKVKHQDFGASDRTTQMITFKDLAILHQLDPKDFKELTITGWEGTGKEGQSVYFNAKDFGDMPVALAARISMGLPIFSPVYWKGRGPFYDGGLGSNAPTEAAPGLDKFYAEHDPADAEEILKGDDIPLEVQQAMQKTMLMTFDNEGAGNRNLYGDGRLTAAPSLGEKILVEKKYQIPDAINPDYGGALKRDASKVHNSGVNTFQVFHGKEGTMSLGVLGGNTEEIEYAENMARLKGLEQIDQRADQAVAVSCKSADEALSTFSEGEMKKFVAAGLPASADPMVQELFRKCQAYLDLDVASKQAKSTGDSTTFVNELVVSQLTATCQAQARQLQNAYQVGVKGNPAPDALKQEVAASKSAIGGLPTYLQAMVKSAVLVPLQQKVRALGQDPANEPPPSFVWKRDFSAKTFDETIRAAAKAGVFPKTKDAENVTDALQSYLRADQNQLDKKKSKDRTKAAREALNKLDELLQNIKKMAESAAYAGNATMQKYLGWLTDRARGQEAPLRSIVKGAAADFPKTSFKPWDEKDWQKNKKAAISAGALEDYGATGLEDAMEAAEKAVQAARQATAPDQRTATGKNAWKAWDHVIRAAKGVQSHTENDNFTAYLEQCVTQATAEREKYPAP